MKYPRIFYTDVTRLRRFLIFGDEGVPGTVSDEAPLFLIGVLLHSFNLLQWRRFLSLMQGHACGGWGVAADTAGNPAGEAVGQVSPRRVRKPSALPTLWGGTSHATITRDGRSGS